MDYLQGINVDLTKDKPTGDISDVILSSPTDSALQPAATLTNGSFLVPLPLVEFLYEQATTKTHGSFDEFLSAALAELKARGMTYSGALLED